MLLQTILHSFQSRNRETSIFNDVKKNDKKQSYQSFNLVIERLLFSTIPENIELDDMIYLRFNLVIERLLFSTFQDSLIYAGQALEFQSRNRETSIFNSFASSFSVFRLL